MSFQRTIQKVEAASWDDQYYGWVNATRLHQFAQRVALFGPFAGILGRALEHELRAIPLINMFSYRLMENSMKENLVFTYDDIEKTRWDNYENDEGQRRSEVPLTSNDQAPSLVLIPKPMYSDHRERDRDYGGHSRASSSSRR